MAEVMTDKQLRQARAHIAALCANWDKGRCLILDSPCPQSASYTLLCNYFKEAVLPDRECAALCADISKADNVRRCVVCGKSLQIKSGRAKYCSGCAIAMRRKRQAEYERRRKKQSVKMSF